MVGVEGLAGEEELVAEVAEVDAELDVGECSSSSVEVLARPIRRLRVDVTLRAPRPDRRRAASFAGLAPSRAGGHGRRVAPGSVVLLARDTPPPPPSKCRHGVAAGRRSEPWLRRPRPAGGSERIALIGSPVPPEGASSPSPSGREVGRGRGGTIGRVERESFSASCPRPGGNKVPGGARALRDATLRLARVESRVRARGR